MHHKRCTDVSARDTEEWTPRTPPKHYQNVRTKKGDTHTCNACANSLPTHRYIIYDDDPRFCTAKNSQSSASSCSLKKHNICSLPSMAIHPDDDARFCFWGSCIARLSLEKFRMGTMMWSIICNCMEQVLLQINRTPKHFIDTKRNGFLAIFYGKNQLCTQLVYKH